MSAPTAKFENGRIFWRGSNPTFTYLRPEDARTILSVFSGEPRTWAAFVQDLNTALAEHDAFEQRQFEFAASQDPF